MIEGLQPVPGTLIPGYGVASGRAESPYPQGSIALQRPHFEARGLDLSGLFMGTLNISIRPYIFHMFAPQLTFERVPWSPHHGPETFSFSPCWVEYGERRHRGWIYYPHPETKPMHFQDPSTVEVLAPAIPRITYGQALRLWLDPNEVTVVNPADVNR